MFLGVVFKSTSIILNFAKAFARYYRFRDHCPWWSYWWLRELANMLCTPKIYNVVKSGARSIISPGVTGRSLLSNNRVTCIWLLTKGDYKRRSRSSAIDPVSPDCEHPQLYGLASEVTVIFSQNWRVCSGKGWSVFSTTLVISFSSPLFLLSPLFSFSFFLLSFFPFSFLSFPPPFSPFFPSPSFHYLF